MSTAPTNAELMAMLAKEQQRNFENMLRIAEVNRVATDLQHRFSIMEAFFIKEYPKYFAGEAALVFASDGEILADEVLPDIHPIDLRTDEEKANGECFRLSDLVDMGAA